MNGQYIREVPPLTDEQILAVLLVVGLEFTVFWLLSKVDLTTLETWLLGITYTMTAAGLLWGLLRIIFTGSLRD
jgi:hypothetical protein